MMQLENRDKGANASLPISLTDTHCHLGLPPLVGSLPGVLQRAFEVGVRWIIQPSVVGGYSQDVTKYDARDVRIMNAVGVHPHFLQDVDDVEATIDSLRDAYRAPNVVAIGECGVDRRVEERVPLKWQNQCFERQLDIAKDLDAPVIVHVVGAHGYVLKQIRSRPGLRGVIHGFTGAASLGEQYIMSGFYLGIGSGLLNENYKNLQQVAHALPLEYMLLETDAPLERATPPAADLTQPRFNEPSQVRDIAHALANKRSLSLAEVAQVTSRNAADLFGFEVRPQICD